MEQRAGVGSGGMTAAESAAPTRDEAARERLRYVPPIGSGPLRESNSGPLVPVQQQESMPPAGGAGDLTGGVDPADRGLQLTATGHEVPEFAAGTAHITQLLAAQFPLGSLPDHALGETVGAAQALVQAAQSLLATATHEAITRGLPGQSGHSVPDWGQSHVRDRARMPTRSADPSLEHTCDPGGLGFLRQIG